MQRQIDYLNQQNTKNIQEMEKKLNETSAQYQGLLNQIKTECNDQITNLRQNLNDSQNTINQRVKQVEGSVPRHLSFTRVHQLGSQANCPDGFLPLSCSCGSGCGSWTIDGQNCKCQCGEWTDANCFQLIP